MYVSAHLRYVSAHSQFVSAHSADAGEPLDRAQQLLGLLVRLAVVARGERAGDAVTDVIVEQPQGQRVERRRRGGDLREDVDAVAVVLDHLLDAAHLPLDPVQAPNQSGLVVGVAGALHTRPGYQRRGAGLTRPARR